MPPIISIVGKSKSGKTTLIEKLIVELRSRGYQVATIKHTPQGMSVGRPDKDSWRHIQAGSEITAASSPDEIVVVKPVSQDSALEQVAYLLGEDCDVILAEGFKQGNAPKIEVHRKEVGLPLKDIKRLVAIVTDEPLETKARQFSLEDIKGLADLLEGGFIEPQMEQTSLYVNDVPIVLTTWPKEVVTKVVLAMASSLKGVEEIKTLRLFLKMKTR